mmetsp:Transcript_88532/g.156193  ORF Transcript_88532/g.156193 Transcript_88532/m.156193 type:complete len:246 (+) Transcript_88532:750-1487(+)
MRRKPHQASLPATLELHNLSVGCSKDAYGSLPITNNLLTLFGHPTVGIAERPRGKTFSQIVLCALIVAAVSSKEVLYCEEAGCWDSRGVHFVVFEVAVGVWQVNAEMPVSIPHAVTTVVLRCVLTVTVGRGEVHCPTWFPPTLFLSNGLNQRANQEVVRIIEVEIANGEHVRDSAHMVVRNSLCDPNGAFARGVSQDVENERFIGITHHQALSTIMKMAAGSVETILFSQLSHEGNGIASFACPL